ncbi:hypothetical protein ACS0TY_032884 [Phlomoides rotata]
MHERSDRQQRQLRLQRRSLFPRKLGLFSSRRKLLRFLLICLAITAILPPLYFHFRLRRFHQIQSQKCSWMQSPPLVCDHGGDSTKAFPNTMNAYNIAITCQTDCIEIDVSRSSDGVGICCEYLRIVLLELIADLGSRNQHSLEFHDVKVPTTEDALKVILDAKVGPPLYERGLAKDILSVVERTLRKNCLVWAKSDSLARDLIGLSADTMVKDSDTNVLVPPPPQLWLHFQLTSITVVTLI